MPSLRTSLGVWSALWLMSACGSDTDAGFDNVSPSAGQSSTTFGGSAAAGGSNNGTTAGSGTIAGSSNQAGQSSQTGGGGAASTAGAAGGGAAAGGNPSQGGSSAGSAGTTPGGMASFVCPPGPYAATPVASGATAERIAGVPPNDAFITDANDTVIIEGPVWFEGNLYVSEIENGSDFGGIGFGGRGGGFGGAAGTGGGNPGADKVAPPARILKITDAGAVSVALPDVGSNGLAIDASGALVACSHKTGSIARLSLAGAAAVDLVSMYMGSRFNSPNDLTFGADGTLYFTDPNYQAPTPTPQAAQLAYRVPPGSRTASPIGNGITQPNGVTLSPDRKTLYISGSNGVFSHPVMADGSVGAGAAFANSAVRSSDGMGMDCAGNLYTTSNQNVIVVSPAGQEVGRISVPGVTSVTNVAFGGEAHKTLYITALGNGTRGGVFKVAAQIPGMPF